MIVFPTETRGDHRWNFGWPLVGEDTISPQAPILGPAKNMVGSPSFPVRVGENVSQNV